MNQRPPSWLTAEATELWERHADILQSPADVEAFTMLVVALSEYRICMEMVTREGRTQPTDRGGIKVHPLLSVMKQHGDTAVRLIGKFKMSPADRGESVENDDGALDDLLAK